MVRMRTWDLETAVENIPGAAIVTAKGRIGRVTAARFAEALAAGRRQRSRLIVDLQNVDYVSGLGLAALTEAAAGVEALILCGVGEAVRNTLELAGLAARVRFEESRQVAIERLRDGP
jgi:anti-anti-sigma factor